MANICLHHLVIFALTDHEGLALCNKHNEMMTLEKKYYLDLSDSIKVGSEITLYRVVALRDFGDIKAGDKGGYIQSESNLSHAGDCWVYGDAIVRGNARIYDNIQVYGDDRIYGIDQAYGDAQVYGIAIVCCDDDYIVFQNSWSSGRYFTYTRSNKKWLVGCFYGTGQELIAKAYQDSETSGREYERVVRYVESIDFEAIERTKNK